MKKQNLAPIFNALSKRIFLLLLSVLAVFLCVCCAPPAALSEPDENTRTTIIDTTAAPAETSISITSTATVSSTPTVENTATSTIASTDTPLPPTSTTAPTETPTPAPTQLSLPACIPAGAIVEAAKVVEIIDGDTIQVEIDGAVQPVRYIGIDTAEQGSDFYEEAFNRNRELVFGKDVVLVKDKSETDSFDRLLRYVFVEGQFVNEVLVKEGYAAAKEYPPDTACNQALVEAQTEASTRGSGIWLVPPTEVVVATATVVATSTVAASTSACPTGCVEELPGCSIKGNINSEGVKIYHTKSSSSYEKTKIDPAKGERWFCTAAEAEANGWRAPRN